MKHESDRRPFAPIYNYQNLLVDAIISSVKIPGDAIIPIEKLTLYLLIPQPKNDKSGFLAQAGFTQENPHLLEQAIRLLIAENEAVLDR